MTEERPSLPNFLVVNGLEYTVIEGGHEYRSETESKYFGTANHELQTITVWSGLLTRQKAFVLVHEAVHCAIKRWSTLPTEEEGICDIAGYTLGEIFVNNPAFLRWYVWALGQGGS